MPFGDGTGPLGQGPMTGRGLGYCSGYRRPGYNQPGWGRGWFGRGRGWFGQGRGLGRRWFGQPAVPYQPTSKKEELDILREEADALKEELKEIESAIQDLKKTENKK